MGTSYLATKAMTVGNPVGLTAWTVTMGAGSPVVTSVALPAPGAVFTP